MHRGVLIGALAGLVFGTVLSAPVALSQSHPTPPPLAVAARRVGPIVLDGKLDEPAWQAATPATDFRQSQPSEGQPATQRTEVRFLYDDAYLYIGARMYDTQGAAVASGGYANFREFNRPRTLERSVYGVDKGTIAFANGSYTVDPDGAGPAVPFSFANPDFNFRSLRGSAVLRWEYHPGSTLYLVWTQTRSASETVGDLELGRDLRGLIGTPPENIFLVKVSYWLGL